MFICELRATELKTLVWICLSATEPGRLVNKDEL